ncbi:hypothetical protein EWM64_g4969 [Hericium alpestre]|uniref:DH domain-containing protein n=1 Tax=Hericium alpestre TaxID=135208 RepID=A0A4Y9ZWU1_9AGAM|nr:hypothetical protein EWM64_g4969 [Hericium alpestre]
MNGSLPETYSYKSLPSPGRGKLPPPPPNEDDFPQFPPPPPPKSGSDPASASSSPGLQPFDLTDRHPPDLNNIPPSPISPTTDSRAKKSNPLIDLIETEKNYVENLTGIIRKVAAAWSRSNLPPPELDLMFRSLEAVFKANRALLSKLKEIGTNPSSPKALGDLLMRWIDDLEGPYTLYCERFCIGFDDWEPVKNNARLPSILASYSAVNPPPLPVDGSAHSSEPPIWTLDQLFLLPKARIKYYKKLYARLRKGTQPGRSDHKLLLGAAEKLDRLLATIESRSTIKAGGGSSPSSPQPEAEDEVVIDFRSQIDNLKASLTFGDSLPAGGSETSSARGSALSSAYVHKHSRALASFLIVMQTKDI